MVTAPTTGEAKEPAPATRETSEPARTGLETSGAGRSGREASGAGRVGRLASEAAQALRRSVGRAVQAIGSRRRVRLIDILRILGLARRAVPRPVVGSKAYVQWWQRLLALVVLVAMMVAIGFALAAAIGLIVVVAGFLLEQAIA